MRPRSSWNLGLGPVFGYEWTARSRRWQGFAARVGFLLFVLLALVMVRTGGTATADETPGAFLARTAREFFQALTLVQLGAVVLAAPAATAGALCQDRSRGSLLLLLTTDLRPREIVVGKLAARLIPVLALLLMLLPVVAIGGLLGGVDLVGLAGVTLVAAGMAVLGCSMALALSNVMGKTHEVLMAVYGLLILWLAGLPMVDALTNGAVPPAIRWWQPLGVIEAADQPGPGRLNAPAGFTLGCLAVSAALVAIAVRDLIPAFRREMGRRPRPVDENRVMRRFRHDVPWWPSPSLDRNPVLWREWHRDRPSRPARVIWLGYAGLATLFSVWVVLHRFQVPPDLNTPSDVPLLNAAQATFGLLLLSVSAATSLAEERARGSLDVLLATPLPTSAVVWGKWWGAYRRVLWLAVLPVTITVGVLWARATPPEVVPAAYLVPIAILTHGAFLTSLGLALATWVPRLGPAVAGSVLGFITLSLAGPLAVNLWESTSDWEMVFYETSPFFRIVGLTSMIEQPGRSNVWLIRKILVSSTILSALELAGAAVLIGLTLLTFNRALGRVPDRAGRPDLETRVGELAQG